MKRVREEGEIEVIDMAKCLMLLSHGLYTKSINDKCSKSNVFECKTCNKQFTSFQALGGHRASHKKPRMLMGEDRTQNDNKIGSNLIKAKAHRCSICGLVFPVGQALGGHMRKHRDVIFSKTPLQKLVSLESNAELLRLDLNLTPLENDLKLLFGNMSPKVDHLFS